MSTETVSPVDADSLIEWEYADGSGSSCRWCARTFRTAFSHMQGRAELHAEMTKDRRRHDEFMVKRSALIARKQAGHRGFKHGEGEGKKRTLTKSRQYAEDLCPPPPQALFVCL